MSEIKNRLKSVDIAPKTFTYKPIAKTRRDKQLKETYPELFIEFEALSIGDENGTVCLVPLDECDREAAKIICEIFNRIKEQTMKE